MEIQLQKWFKFYGIEYLADQKMLRLSACRRSCWITLLAYASQSNGVVKNLDESTLMVQAGVNFQDDEWERTIGVLDLFEELEMIKRNNGTIVVRNWKKRQETNLTGYERVKRWRARKDDNAMITDDTRSDNGDDNARLDKKRIDKNREDKNIYTASFEKFWEAYPKKTDKKKASELWEKRKLSRHLDAILEFIPKALETDKWKKGFIKNPTTFLNGECWNDDLEGYNDKNYQSKKGLTV